ncbi:PadR family transcriptional regulator, partial [Streptomyces sp. NPDC047974]
FQRIAQQVQDEVQNRFAKGEWPQAVREGLSGITAQLSDLVSGQTKGRTGAGGAAGGSPVDVSVPGADGEAVVPEWAREGAGSGDPARDLDRLLDRFRDEVRDAARDHGVTDAQLAEARHHLSAAATRIAGILRPRTER